MPTKLTVGCVALAAVTCLAGGTAMAAPLGLNKGSNADNAPSNVQNVDYRCYRRQGRRVCQDTYDDYDAFYYDYDGYGPVGSRHRRGGGIHFYRSRHDVGPLAVGPAGIIAGPTNRWWVTGYGR
jgi:hypothetical protein